MHTNIKKLLLNNINSCILVEFDDDANEQNLIDNVAYNLNNGVKMIIFSSKVNSFKRIIEVGRKVRQLCSLFDSIFLVQNRADIAKVLDSDGITLNHDDINIKDAIEIIGNEKFIANYYIQGDNSIYHDENNIDFIIIENNISPALKSNLEALNCKKIIHLEKMK